MSREIWDKQREYHAAKEIALKLGGELTRLKAEAARAKITHLPKQQSAVLVALSSINDEYSWTFKTIGQWSGLTRDQVSRACKALRRLGLAAFQRGLFTEDGEAAGSGYSATDLGRQWVRDGRITPRPATPEPCRHCNDAGRAPRLNGADRCGCPAAQKEAI